MAKSRDRIRMTDEELRDFLEAEKTLQVATLDRDGAPHLTTLWFAVVDNHIVFHTYGKSQKIVNLKRDPRIAVLLEAGTTYGELRGVSIQGRAELIEDELKYRYAAAVSRRYSDRPEEQIEAATRKTAAKRTVVRVIPEKTVSWDHRKLESLDH